MQEITVVIPGYGQYADENYKYGINIPYDELCQKIDELGIQHKLYDDDFSIIKEDQQWFLDLEHKNPWFASEVGLLCVLEEGYLHEADHLYIDLVFNTVKAFIPAFQWRKLKEDELPPKVHIGGSQKFWNYP
jgi:hypothetical protein